jgi:hypothetical protein
LSNTKPQPKPNPKPNLQANPKPNAEPNAEPECQGCLNAMQICNQCHQPTVGRYLVAPNFWICKSCYKSTPKWQTLWAKKGA